MRKLIFLIFVIIPFITVYAQDDAKYLKGAVTEVGGKVVFSKFVNTGNLYTENQLFDKVNQWAEAKYTNEKDEDLKNRVLLSDAEAKNIACYGETKFVFRKSTFTLDQAIFSYQLILEIGQTGCNATIRGMKYTYSDLKGTETAEELITDEKALNKDGTKLERFYDKFRRNTVDSVNSIFNSLERYLVTQGPATHLTQPVTQASIQQPAATVTQSLPAVATVASSEGTGGATLAGFRKVDADRIPGNIIHMLSNDWSLITSGKEGKANTMTASWGGVGRFWEKPVAFCFLNPTRYSVKTMDDGDTYTISFYTAAYKDALNYAGSVSGRNTDKIKGIGLTPIVTPSGAPAFAEAWMIFECKKIVAQPISADAVIEKPANADWTKNGYHKLYIGEILNVWIK